MVVQIKDDDEDDHDYNASHDYDDKGDDRNVVNGEYTMKQFGRLKLIENRMPGAESQAAEFTHLMILIGNNMVMCNDVQIML